MTQPAAEAGKEESSDWLNSDFANKQVGEPETDDTPYYWERDVEELEADKKAAAETAIHYDISGGPTGPEAYGLENHPTSTDTRRSKTFTAKAASLTKSLWR